MINVFFGINDAYAKHCAAVMASVLANHTILSPEDKIHFFILGNLRQDTKTKLLTLKAIQDFECSFVNVDDSVFSKIPLKNWHVSCCYRLLSPEILPDDVKKIIYLDSDLILNSDVKNLWDIDISGYLAAAIANEPGENRKATYFNSGVMVLNITELKRFDFPKKWREFIKKLPKGAVLKYPDQDILNAIIDNVLLLPANWNVEKYNLSQMLKSGKTADELRKDIFIVHYTTQAKPWFPISDHPFKDLYVKYAKMTAWADEVNNHSFAKKASYLIKIILKYWAVHPVFFLKSKFYKKIKKQGLLSSII
ncbi:MAG: glycosyltransferase family 8 protein [Endomicrobium sp.]|jgi:lipopolysaccharide biosynthesis glycosyltransferase|nr:glycosyltransferase family 8 protein [Endomicrobium sp.]